MHKIQQSIDTLWLTVFDRQYNKRITVSTNTHQHLMWPHLRRSDCSIKQSDHVLDSPSNKLPPVETMQHLDLALILRLHNLLRSHKKMHGAVFIVNKHKQQMTTSTTTSSSSSDQRATQRQRQKDESGKERATVSLPISSEYVKIFV